MRFVAKVHHPLLSRREWTSSDIQKLRDTVEAEIDGAVQDHDEASWAPAWLVQAHVTDRDFHGALRTGFEIEVTPVSLRSGDEMRNDHKRRIIQNGAVRTVSEGGVNERSSCLKIGEKTALVDNPRSLCVVPASPRNDDAIQHLRETLHRFSFALGNAVSPDGIAAHGVPTTEFLIEMLTKAAKSK
jgi:hypothetical protein